MYDKIDKESDRMNLVDSLNDRQKEAVVNTDGPMLILAGAGSGKTKVLTTKVAYLIEEKNIDPNNILAITFTNKAAKEMKERIFKLEGNSAFYIQISTFHSFGLKILKENDFELKEVYDIKDIYMIDKKYKNIEDKLELLKHAILIRDIIEENKETKQITYKYKEYDENGNITKQGKTNCKINSIEEAVNLFNALGYEKLININDHLLVYANKDDEFVIECVNNKHIYIEIEDKCNYIDKCYKSDEEMKDAINKYNLPLKQNNYYAKKALDELNEI